MSCTQHPDFLCKRDVIVLPLVVGPVYVCHFALMMHSPQIPANHETIFSALNRYLKMNLNNRCITIINLINIYMGFIYVYVLFLFIKESTACTGSYLVTKFGSQSIDRYSLSNTVWSNQQHCVAQPVIILVFTVVTITAAAVKVKV